MLCSLVKIMPHPMAFRKYPKATSMLDKMAYVLDMQADGTNYVTTGVKAIKIAIWLRSPARNCIAVYRSQTLKPLLTLFIVSDNVSHHQCAGVKCPHDKNTRSIIPMCTRAFRCAYLLALCFVHDSFPTTLSAMTLPRLTAIILCARSINQRSQHLWLPIWLFAGPTPRVGKAYVVSGRKHQQAETQGQCDQRLLSGHRCMRSK